MIKLYASIAIAGVLAGAVWRYDYVTQQNDELKIQLKKSIAEIEAERNAVQAAANLALAARVEELGREKEHQKYVDCVNAGQCGARLRYQSCPGVPQTVSGESGATPAAPESNREFQQWVNNHTALIIKYENTVKHLRAENLALSKTRCNP